MRSIHLIVEPKTPDGKGLDVPYAIHVASPGPYADRDESGIRVAVWGAGLFNCCTHLVPNCFMATLCPCVSLAQITSRMSLYRYKTMLCGLFSVAIVQLLLAIVAFVQVHGSASSTNLSEDYFRRKSSWWSSHNRALLPEHRDNNDDNDYDTSSSLAEDARAMAASPWGVLCLLLGLVYVFVAWHLRMKIRERFLIRGSWYADLLISLLLPSCNVAQMATHVKSYKPGKCDFGPADVLPAYPPLC